MIHSNSAHSMFWPTKHIQRGPALLLQPPVRYDGHCVFTAVIQHQITELQGPSAAVQWDPVGIPGLSHIDAGRCDDVDRFEAPADGDKRPLRRAEAGGEPHCASNSPIQQPVR